MADAEWIENVKRIVLKAVDAGDPCDVIPGRVIKTAPLEVQIGQKTILSDAQVWVPRHLTDHVEVMSIPGVGTVSVTVKGALAAGEEVMLIQERGGQHYFVAGRW